MTEIKMTPGELIARYRSLRDMVKVMEDKHKSTVAPYKSGMEAIENYLMQLMIEQDVTSFKAECGTAFQKTTMSVHTADKEALMRHVEETSAFDLLTAAVSKDALTEYLKEHNDTPPPGVDVRFIKEVQIRKPS